MTQCGCSWYPTCAKVWTSAQTHSIGPVQYVHTDRVDTENYIQQTNEEFELTIGVPTAERVIVETILHQELCDEGIMLQGIRNYLDSFCTMVNMPLLYEVADFYRLDWNTLEHWLQEAREEEFPG
ncbi:MAG: hypothetical protein RSC43_00145 [Clostridia bacterium]